MCSMLIDGSEHLPIFTDEDLADSFAADVQSVSEISLTFPYPISNPGELATLLSWVLRSGRDSLYVFDPSKDGANWANGDIQQLITDCENEHERANE